MRVASVDSETMRPPQIASSSSSLLMTLAAIADQVFKQIEDLRLNGHNGVAAAELAPPGVENITIENKNQLLARKRGFALPRHCLPVCHMILAPHLAKENQGRVKEISRSAQGVDAAPLALSRERRTSGDRTFPIGGELSMLAGRSSAHVIKSAPWARRRR